MAFFSVAWLACSSRPVIIDVRPSSSAMSQPASPVMFSVLLRSFTLCSSLSATFCTTSSSRSSMLSVVVPNDLVRRPSQPSRSMTTSCRLSSSSSRSTFGTNFSRWPTCLLAWAIRLACVRMAPRHGLASLSTSRQRRWPMILRCCRRSASSVCLYDDRSRRPTTVYGPLFRTFGCSTATLSGVCSSFAAIVSHWPRPGLPSHAFMCPRVLIFRSAWLSLLYAVVSENRLPNSMRFLRMSLPGNSFAAATFQLTTRPVSSRMTSGSGASFRNELYTTALRWFVPISLATRTMAVDVALLMSSQSVGCCVSAVCWPSGVMLLSVLVMLPSVCLNCSWRRLKFCCVTSRRSNCVASAEAIRPVPSSPHAGSAAISSA